MLGSIMERIRELWVPDKIIPVPETRMVWSEFVITNHARERIIQRIKCNPNKIEKLVIKAWYSTKEPVPASFVWYQRAKGYRNENVKYRKFLGFMWVFEQNHRGQKVLITMFREHVFENNAPPPKK